MIGWHRRVWSALQPGLTPAWGKHHTNVWVAVAADANPAARPACSVISRTLRWRPVADVAALRTIAMGQLGSWRSGRSRGGGRILGLVEPDQGQPRGGHRAYHLPIGVTRETGCGGVTARDRAWAARSGIVIAWPFFVGVRVGSGRPLGLDVSRCSWSRVGRLHTVFSDRASA